MTIKSKWARLCVVVNGRVALVRGLAELAATVEKNKIENSEMHADAVEMSLATAMSYREAYEHLKAKENDSE